MATLMCRPVYFKDRNTDVAMVVMAEAFCVSAVEVVPSRCLLLAHELTWPRQQTKDSDDGGDGRRLCQCSRDARSYGAELVCWRINLLLNYI